MFNNRHRKIEEDPFTEEEAEFDSEYDSEEED